MARHRKQRAGGYAPPSPTGEQRQRAASSDQSRPLVPRTTSKSVSAAETRPESGSVRARQENGPKSKSYGPPEAAETEPQALAAPPAVLGPRPASARVFVGPSVSSAAAAATPTGAAVHERPSQALRQDSVPLKTFPYKILSWHPRAILYPGFLSLDECQTLIDLTDVYELHPSGVRRDGRPATIDKGVRNSYDVSIDRDQDDSGTIARVEDRICDALMVPIEHCEGLSIIRYRPGQFFRTHWDGKGPRNSERVVSVLLYLNEDFEGGETVFPLEGHGNTSRMQEPGFSFDQFDGPGTMVVQPRAGDALAFWSRNLDGSRDDHSLHGSRPVTRGTKMVVTQWIASAPINRLALGEMEGVSAFVNRLVVL